MIKGTLERRLALRKKETFIVESILPAGEVHLIGGASGAGKTTWLLWWLREWSRGNSVFGLRSFPVPFVYVSFDRGLATFDRTLRRLGMEDWDIPAYDVADLNLQEANLFNIVAHFPEAELYVIEGFQGCLDDAMKGASQNKCDMRWSVRVRQKITSKGKTILGITHAPKMKQGESYVSTRSRFLGTQSLLASTGTLIMFENPQDVQDSREEAETEDRMVRIEGPNFPKLIKHYTRDSNGGFLEKTEEQQTSVNLEGWLDRIEPGTQLTTAQIQEMGKNIGLTQDFVKHWIVAKVAEGVIAKQERGVYVRMHKQ
jgi:AAA domain